jgi:putative N-acetylmannosamine-6-phosphate epimerase
VVVWSAYGSFLAFADLDLVAALVSRLAIPVVAEGCIRAPAEASRALELGRGRWSSGPR